LLLQWGKHLETVMKNGKLLLQQLQQKTGHELHYFNEQWVRQREVQLGVIETKTEKELREKIEHLIELEDKIWDTQYVLNFHPSKLVCL
jgi:hypothetical protein